MNRIVKAIDAKKTDIAKRIADGIVTAEKVEETRKALDMQLDEIVTFQNLKSEACLTGKLTTDEGMTIYNYLGEGGPEKFNSQPVEVKAVLTHLLAELLKMRIAA